MIGDKEECLDTIERYRKVGVTHFIFMLFQPFPIDELQAFAEDVMPAVRVTREACVTGAGGRCRRANRPVTDPAVRDLRC